MQVEKSNSTLEHLWTKHFTPDQLNHSSDDYVVHDGEHSTGRKDSSAPDDIVFLLVFYCVFLFDDATMFFPLLLYNHPIPVNIWKV